VAGTSACTAACWLPYCPAHWRAPREGVLLCHKHTLNIGSPSLVSSLLCCPPAAVLQVVAATNRADILDPALMRSGRLDRKIEFPHPNEDARAKILRIHSRKMNVAPDVNFEELARSSDDFNAAQLKAVCVEAGMLALRRDGLEVNHEDFVEGIVQVQAKKKATLQYYA